MVPAPTTTTSALSKLSLPSGWRNATPVSAPGSAPEVLERPRHARRRDNWRRRLTVLRRALGGLLEVAAHLLGTKARELRVAVSIPEPIGAQVVAAREHDVKLVSGARQGDVEEATLLLEALLVGQCHVRRNHPIGGMQNVDDVPLTSLRRVDRAEHEVVVIKQRTPGEIRSRLRRIQDEIAQEPGARRVARRDLFETFDVLEPARRRAVDAGEDRFEEPAHSFDLRRHLESRIESAVGHDRAQRVEIRRGARRYARGPLHQGPQRRVTAVPAYAKRAHDPARR